MSNAILSPYTGRPLPANSSIAKARIAQAAAKPTGLRPDTADPMAVVQDLSPSLARYMRPQSAFQWWTLPYLSGLTPQYIQNLLISALAGNHVPVWQLFDIMIDTDPELAACIGEYVDGILKKKIIFEPYHEEDQEPTPSAIERCRVVSSALRNMRPDPASDENNLKATLRDILFSRFHGQSILEEDWFDTFGTGKLNQLELDGIGIITAPRCTFWVHPICYAYDIAGRIGLRIPPQNIQEVSRKAGSAKPSAGVLPDDYGFANALSYYGYSGSPRPASLTEFPENEFIIAIQKFKSGSALAGSCLRPLAWWWCVANFAGDWLLDLAQIFGIPFRKAKYEQGTPEPIKNEVREQLQNMGSRGWCLLDQRVTLDFEKAIESGAQSPQGYLIELAHQQMRKVVLRQTMTGTHGTTGKGGGQAFGQTEQDVKHDCMQAGADYACDILRDQPARHILMVNYGEDSELPFIRMMEEQEGSYNDMQRDQIGAQVVDIGENYFRKKYNYPKPAPGEKIAGKNTGTGATPPKPPGGTGPANSKNDGADGNGQTDGANKQPPDTESNASRLDASIPGAPAESFQTTAVKQYAEAFAEDTKHALDRLAAIAEIKDDKVFLQKLREFQSDFPQLKKDILADPKAARALQPIIATSLANGLARDKSTPKKS